MKPGTGILIGIGALSVYLLWSGQKAAAAEGEGGGGSPISILFPGNGLPGDLPGGFTMPEFAFTMPEFTFNIAEGGPPPAADGSQGIIDALTGLFAGLGGGGLPELPGLPGADGNGGGGFDLKALQETLATFWANWSQGALPELPGLPEAPFSPAGESLASAWQHFLGIGRNLAETVEGAAKVVEAISSVPKEITTFPQKIMPTLQGWTGYSRDPALLTAAGRAQATREFEQYSAEIALKREEQGLVRVGDMWVSPATMEGWVAYAESVGEAEPAPVPESYELERLKGFLPE